jgi:hypothetical protein
MVKFRAAIVDVDKGVTFPLFEFNPNEPVVERVEIEGPKDTEILSRVHVSAVATAEEGIGIATKVHVDALNRISFNHGIAIDNGRVTESGFSPIDPPPPGNFRITPGTGHYSIDGKDVRFVHGLTADSLKSELEQVKPPGERSFGLFRSALQSTSPVEQFMHLYNILLMYFDDEKKAQNRLDKFIRKVNPKVEMKPYCRPAKSGKQKMVLETVYTRLRNEFAHSRTGANIEQTKVEMTERLSELRELAKRAIESLS